LVASENIECRLDVIEQFGTGIRGRLRDHRVQSGKQDALPWKCFYPSSHYSQRDVFQKNGPRDGLYFEGSEIEMN
jgi:hypothetical protein